MKQIAIYGSGGFGREVAWLAKSCQEIEIECFIDDDPLLNGQFINDIPVMPFDAICRNTRGNEQKLGIVSAIGDPKVRKQLMVKARQAGFSFETLIHPRTEMSRWVEISEGTVICAGCILTTNIRLGKHVQINLDCTIGHDVVMEDYATLAPGVHVSGFVHLGKQVYVGTGAVFLNGTREKPLVIGDDAVIGAGACVTKSVPPNETWGGGTCEAPEKELNTKDRFQNWQYPEIEDGKPTKYNWVVQHKDHLALGYKTDIGAFTYINAKYGVTIEDHVQIGSHCAIYSVSTIDDKTGPVVLKKNCRIGTHSTVMPGVTVGENAVVGAHSFVNRDVPDGAVAFGVPVKVNLKNDSRKNATAQREK